MGLTACFMPCLALLRTFQNQPCEDIAVVTARLDEVLAVAMRRASQENHRQADIDNALFAVVAWADEIFLKKAWSGAAQWQRNLLQRRFFNTSHAGVAFFSRLERLQAELSDVREIYALCLAMGFSGRYGYERDAATLESIKRANFDMLLADDDWVAGSPAALAFPAAYPPAAAHQPAPARFQPLTLALLGGPVVALAVLYGVYHVVINQLVNTVHLGT